MPIALPICVLDRPILILSLSVVLHRIGFELPFDSYFGIICTIHKVTCQFLWMHTCIVEDCFITGVLFSVYYHSWQQFFSSAQIIDSNSLVQSSNQNLPQNSRDVSRTEISSDRFLFVSYCYEFLWLNFLILFWFFLSSMMFTFRCCITTKTQVRKKKTSNFRTAGALPTNGILQIRMTTGARRAQVDLRSHPFNSRRHHDSSNSSIAAAPQPPHRPPSSLRKRWVFFDR